MKRLDDFVSEYARGRTPIPCVRCNTFTKFRDLVRKADAIDARWVATGHYARMIGGVLHRALLGYRLEKESGAPLDPTADGVSKGAAP